MHDENLEKPEETQASEELHTFPAEEKPAVQKKPFFAAPTFVEWILLLGLVVLYILFLTSNKQEKTVPLAFQKAGTKSTSVVFVNIDSLNTRYEFIRNLKGDLEATGKRLQNEILSEQAAFEKEAAEFQKQVAANSIPEDKAKMIYEKLMQKQQSLVDKKDRYTQQVAEKEMKMNLTLLDTVTNFLKRYNKIYKYDYIMGLKTAGEILVANDTLDITNDVVNALNKTYKEKKK
jgi:outer membrane protein